MKRIKGLLLSSSNKDKQKSKKKTELSSSSSAATADTNNPEKNGLKNQTDQKSPLQEQVSNPQQEQDILVTPERKQKQQTDNHSTSSTEKEAYSPQAVEARPLPASSSSSPAKTIIPDQNVPRSVPKRRNSSSSGKGGITITRSLSRDSSANSSSSSTKHAAPAAAAAAVTEESQSTSSSPGNNNKPVHHNTRQHRRRPSMEHRLLNSQSIHQNLPEHMQFQQYLDANLLALKDSKAAVMKDAVQKAQTRTPAEPIPESPAPNMLKELRRFVAKDWNRSKKHVVPPTNSSNSSNKKSGTNVSASEASTTRSSSRQKQPADLDDKLKNLNASNSSLSLEDVSFAGSSTQQQSTKRQSRKKATRRSSIASNSSRKSEVYLPGNHPRAKKQNASSGGDLMGVGDESGKSHTHSHRSTRRPSGSKTKRMNIRNEEKATFPKHLQEKLANSLDLNDMLNMSKLSDSSSGADGEGSSSRGVLDNSVLSQGSMASEGDSKRRKKKRRASKKKSPETLPGELDEMLSSQDELMNSSRRANLSRHSSQSSMQSRKSTSSSKKSGEDDAPLTKTADEGNGNEKLTSRQSRKSAYEEDANRRSLSRNRRQRTPSVSSRSQSKSKRSERQTTSGRSKSQSSISKSSSSINRNRRPSISATHDEEQTAMNTASVTDNSSQNIKKESGPSETKVTKRPNKTDTKSPKKRGTKSKESEENKEPRTEPIVSHEPPGAPPAPTGSKKSNSNNTARQSMDGTAHSCGNSLGAPSQHSLNSYLPDVMKGTTSSEAKKPSSLGPKFDSDAIHNIDLNNSGSMLTEMPEEDDNDVFQYESDELVPSRRTSITGIMSSMKQMLKKPFKSHSGDHNQHAADTSNSSALKDEGPYDNDDSIRSIDLMGGSSEDNGDMTVFKFDESDKYIPQFNPNQRPEDVAALHHSCSAVDRIHQRRSLRAKRASQGHKATSESSSRSRGSKKLDQHLSEGENKLKKKNAENDLKESLHSSCSQIDELKAELASRKARKKRLEKRSKERNKPKDVDEDNEELDVESSYTETKKEKTASMTKSTSVTDGSRTRTRRRLSEAPKEASTPNTTSSRSRRSTKDSNDAHETPSSTTSRNSQRRRRISLPKQEPRSLPKVPQSLDGNDGAGKDE